MFASAIFLFGFWLKILPDNVTSAPGLAAAMSNFGVGLLIVNLGTLIDLEDMIKEWKTVVVALLGMVGVVIGALTIGAMLFGREWALTAVPATAGGTIAVLLVQTAANTAGRPEVAAFAILVMSFRKFIGMPIATYGMKRELTAKIARGDFSASAASSGKTFKLPDIRIFKPTAKASNTNNMKLFKLAIVATVANLVGLATQIPGADAGNYFLNPNISYLLFGLLFTRLGFLEKGTLQKADSYGLMMLGLMLMLPGTLAQVEPMDVVEMIVPLAGLLVIYSLATCVVAIIIGKLVDSLIIGIICFIGVTILNMPFPMLLSVIIGVTNVIPFFGPFIGAIPAAFLVFLVSPLQCVYFLIWILLLQQFDGNILGPKILGNSTGLSSFWVLFSILFFGGLFGFVGMIIAVPAFAVIYDLISRAVHRSLRLRKLPMETDEYRKLDHIDEKTGTFMELNKK